MYNTNSHIWLLVEGAPTMPSSQINLNAAIEIDAPVERVWPLFSDTDRVNRLIGLPGFERTDLDQDLTRIIQGHYLGIPVAWREYPFEWVFEQWFQVERAFMPPLPIDRIITGARLMPLPGDPMQRGFKKPWDQAVIVALDKATGKVRWKANRGLSRLGHVTFSISARTSRRNCRIFWKNSIAPS